MQIFIYFLKLFFLVDFVNSYKFLEQDLNKISIRCMANCMPTISNRPIILRLLCGNKICSNQLHVQWDLRELAEEIDIKNVVIATKYDILYIPANAFTTTTKMSFSVKTKHDSLNFSLPILKLHTSFTIVCLQNCPSGYPDRDTKFQFICNPACRKMITTWIIHPRPQSQFLNFGPNNESLTITKGAYGDNSFIKIIVFSDLARFDYNLELSFRKVKLKIICKENCVQPNYRKAIILAVQCEGCLPTDSITWALKPEPYKYDIKNGTLKIYPHTIPDGIETIVTAQVKNRGTDFFTLTHPCRIEPNTGISGITKFKIACDFWYGKYINVYDNTDVHNPRLLYRGNSLDTAEFLLPPGYPRVVIVITDKSHQLLVIVKDFTLPAKQIFKMLINQFSKLENFSANNQMWLASQLAFIIIDNLKNLETDHRKHCLRKLINDLVEIEDDLQPDQTLTLIGLMINVSQHREIELDSLDCVSKTLYTAAKLLNIKCQNYGKTILEDLISNASKFSVELQRRATYFSDDLLVTEKEKDSDYPLYQELSYKRAFMLHHLRHLTYYTVSTFGLISNLTNSKGSFTTLSLHEEDFVTESLVLSSESTTTSVHVANSIISLSDKLQKALTVNGNALLSITAFKLNPFWWHHINSQIKSEVVLLKAFIDGTEITNLPDPINLHMKTDTKDFNQKIIRGNLNDKVFKTHQIVINANYVVDIIFIHVGFDYRALISNYLPNVHDIKRNGLVIRNHADLNKRRIFVNKTFYIGVMQSFLNEPMYEIKLFARGCQSWSESERIWTSQYCQVRELTNDTYTHCECSHLSMFSVIALVPPNKILNLRTVTVGQLFARSYVIIIFVICAIILWILMMVVAHQKDSAHFKNSLKIDKLEDDLPGRANLYIACVEPGINLHISTSARIILQLNGKYRKSDRHLINHKSIGLDSKWFAFHTDDELGDLQSIRIFHDSYGPRPHWFCYKITIFHPKSNNTYEFIVRKWFSILYGDGITDRVIELAEKSKKFFKNASTIMLIQNVWPELRDKHLWISIFYRPAESTFTSMERVTLAFTLVLLSMLTSAMFYHHSKREFSANGTLSIGLTELIVTIQTLLITVPTGILLLALFRYSKPHKRNKM